MQEVLEVPGMSCGHCKDAVEGALRPLDGVEVAEVDLEAKSVRVAFDESRVSHDRLVEAIRDAGYDVA